MVRGIANSKIGFGDLILLLRYFFKLKVSTHPNYLQLSQTFLKGQILEKLGQNQTAEEYWTNQLAQAHTLYQKALFETALSKHLNIKQDYSAFIGKQAKISQPNRLCCTNPVKDSPHESSMIAGMYEQLVPHKI